MSASPDSDGISLENFKTTAPTKRNPVVLKTKATARIREKSPVCVAANGVDALFAPSF
jgi:hypothetical protein